MASIFSTGHITLSSYKTQVKNMTSGVILFWGDEDYLKQLQLQQLRDRIDPTSLEFNDIKLDFSRDATFETLSYEITALSMIGGQRLIEVRGLDLLSLRADDEKKLLTALDSIGDDTIVLLYFSAWELDLNKKNKQKKIIRALEETALIVEFPLQTLPTIQKLFAKKASGEGIAFSDETIAAMVDQVGSSLLLLRFEYDKLAMFVRHEDRSEITVEDVRRICITNVSFSLNQLPEAVFAGNRQQVMTIFHRLCAEKTEPTVIVATLSRAFATMIATVSGEHRGYSRRDIAQTVGSFDWLITKYAGYARRYSPARLTAHLRACVDADTRIKSSGLDAYLICEQLLYTLTGR